MSDQEEKGFIIKDRRRFDESGSARPSEPEAPKAEKQRAEAASGSDAKKPKPDEAAGSKPAEPLPPIDFTTFVFSLGTSVMLQFGDFPDTAPKNLEAAKQTIDILAILKDKTKGNLSREEEDLLDGLLYECRMRFVKESSLG